MTIILLALRNVILQWKRYILMFVAILLGFSLVLLVYSLTSGAMETVKSKAARYFSGHISITGYLKSQQYIDDPIDLVTVLSNSDLSIRTISPRTIYYRNNASLFFNGESVKQRRLIGIDFEKEKDELSLMEFLDGSIENILEKESEGILISEAAAEILKAQVGDDIIVNLTTDEGLFNSTTLFVKGIFRETSLFGYVAYINQSVLNELLLLEPWEATDIAIYSKKGVDDNQLLKEIRTVLSKSHNLLPPMESKDDLKYELSRWKTRKIPVLAPLTLNAHLDQITIIIDAVKIVTFFIQILFLFIIMVGILNTYRVLVYERTKEIGALRAMGMTRFEVRFMFLAEALFLGVGGMLCGYAVYLLMVGILGKIDISSLPGAGLFTDSGLLNPFIELSIFIRTAIMMLVAVLIAAWSPAGSASRLSPVDAMREGN